MATRDFSAADRNKGAILEVLTRHLPVTGVVLEVASGAGIHVSYFASRLTSLTWQPSEADPELVQIMAARFEKTGLPNLMAPVLLDVLDPAWPVSRCNAIVNINMVHISPPATAEALFAHAGELLDPGEPVCLYGPFTRHGRFNADSNRAFDALLRSQNPAWGLRDVDDMAALAAHNGFELTDIIDMPANNTSLVFRRQASVN